MGSCNSSVRRKCDAQRPGELTAHSCIPHSAAASRDGARRDPVDFATIYVCDAYVKPRRKLAYERSGARGESASRCIGNSSATYLKLEIEQRENMNRPQGG